MSERLLAAMRLWGIRVAGVAMVMGASAWGNKEGQPTRVGIIGCDTSHVIAFTEILNNPDAKGDVAGFRVVAAYPGGSVDIESSRDRVDGYVKELRERFGVEIVDTIDAVIEKSDVILLESVDGRPHLEQARPVFAAGKRVFIDKPVAGSLADAVAIFGLAEKTGTPCFTSSSLRYSPSIADLRNNSKVGEVLGCSAFGPCPLEEHHPDLFWYGIHGVESLFTVMGPGCESVSRVSTEGAELVTGIWANGRIGTFRGIREGHADYGATAFGSSGIVQGQGYGGYEPLLVEICKFFRTGTPPVSAQESLEIYAFMEAADESKRQGGASVSIKSVMERAQKAAVLNRP